MLVVSDTSPIHALHHLSLLHVLPKLFGEVLIPPAVVAELRSPASHLPSLQVQDLPFVRVASPQDLAQVARLELTLDAGESQAIALAVELHAAILIDEDTGRRVARRFGLPVTGVVGILLRAKSRGLIGDIGPLLERLRREIKFFISDALLREALSLAGEKLP